MTIVLMGVTASGKTTVGQRLAQRLEWVFVDADDYHSAANKEKMTAGTPLTDEDRAPWLAQLHELLEDWDEAGINGVLACSALKEKYRAQLAGEIPPGELRFAWLDVDRDLLEQRLQNRAATFMNPALLDSQIVTLEPPANALRIPARDGDGRVLSVEEQVERVLTGLHLPAAQD